MGWAFVGGGQNANFEGQFAARPETGEIVYINGCRGDNYGITVLAGVVYTVGHAHDCEMIGGQPQESPSRWQRAMAFTPYASLSGRNNARGPYTNWQHFPGQPGADILHWYPLLTAGTYTGNTQGAYTVEGNSDYLVLGGEFPSVNGVAQQGLVRFPSRAIAPNRDAVQGYNELLPTIAPVGAGSVRIGWKAAFDRDNERLRYEVLRGPTLATSVAVGTIIRDQSAWWTRPLMGFVDRTAPPGSTQTYRIRATDPFGNNVAGPTASVVIPADAPTVTKYRDTVQADNPVHHWRLGETSGSLARDWAASEDLLLSSTATRTSSGAIVGDSDGATTFPGSSSTSIVQAQPNDRQTGPEVFSVEAWIRTNTKVGGKIIGYGNSRTGRSSTNTTDRNLYMTNNGQIRFGVRPDYGSRITVNSANGLNDNKWHHVVGTLGTTGLRLYVDGQLVDANASVTKAQVYSGYWRIGGDQLGSWPSVPSREAIDATLDEIAVYHTALTPQQVIAHREAGLGAPTAAFTSSVADLDVSFDGSTSTDNGIITGYNWDFGDGTTGTGVTSTHRYAAAGTYTVSLRVTDDDGRTGTTSKQVTTFAPNVAPTASFSATVTDLTAALDGRASTDSDGSVVGFAWDFGDGSTDSTSGPVLNHRYAAPGTYTVTLTVTDNRGGTGSTSSSITTTLKAGRTGTEFVDDEFGREVTNGLGVADLGGAWTLTGPTSSFSVTGGAARIQIALGASRATYLADRTVTDSDMAADVSLSQTATGGGAYVSLIGRRVSNGNDYRVKLRYQSNGQVIAYLVRTIGGTETVLTTTTVPGLTVVADDVLRVRFQVAGTASTTLQAKVWRAGTTEPAGWLATTTDSSAALQAPGHIGTYHYLASSWTGPTPVISIDNVIARPPTP